MPYEERVGSVSGLARRLRSLDQDAGIRILGRLGKRKVLVFVTRFESRYMVMTYSMKKGGGPGTRLRAVELDKPEEVIEALRKVAKGRLQARIY